MFKVYFVNIKFILSGAFALFYQASVSQEINSNLNLKPYLGYHYSDFDWSIAGNSAGNSPNILSELIWTNLQGPSVGLDISYRISKRLSCIISSQYTTITKGRVEDSDYADDDRENVFYYDVFNADKGYLYDLSSEISYRLAEFRQLSLHPMLGISYKQQTFFLLEREINLESVGLNSNYKVKNVGINFGANIILTKRGFQLGLKILAGFYQYSAKANWNLIPEFAKPVSFVHDANSTSLSGDLNLSIPLNNRLWLEFDVKLKQTKTHSGNDTAYFINQSSERTKFNGANFMQHGASIGFSLDL